MNRKDITKSLGFVVGVAVIVAVQSTNAFAGRHDRDDHREWKRHRHHSDYGKVVRIPEHQAVVIGGGFYYYDGIFCKKRNGIFITINPPLGSVVASIPIGCKTMIIAGKTYYHHDDVYYVKRPDGYIVVKDPVYQTSYRSSDVHVVAHKNIQPIDVDAGAYDVNIPNDNGSYTTVTITKSGSGYVGPQGEFYPQFPKVSQLKVMYGSPS